MYPMKLQPAFQDYLWGGSRLKDIFDKQSALSIVAESWELSCHPDGHATVVNGCLAGETLEQVLTTQGLGLLGDRYRGDGEFPILVKFIDAAQDLSIQVHPSDQSALSGESGKAEMWYVVDAAPRSYLYYGFNRPMTQQELLRRATDGTICEVLNQVPVKRGDVFYILPGTVHAIGKGLVIAEIQQNSNTTFRIYDYQRKGADGKLRPLHLERAAAVANYTPSVPSEARSNSGLRWGDFSLSEMFSCRYFRAFRASVTSQADFYCDQSSFQHLLFVEGEGTLHWRDQQYPVRRGDSYFLPAGLGRYRISGCCCALMSML